MPRFENEKEFIRRPRFDEPMSNRGMRHHQHHHCIINEIKLFTVKDEMVSYVNQLQNIENVEIFKIEDSLYKVLVSRKKHHDGQCHPDQEEPKE